MLKWKNLVIKRIKIKSNRKKKLMKDDIVKEIERMRFQP
jgi:hypothetical protein